MQTTVGVLRIGVTQAEPASTGLARQLAPALRLSGRVEHVAPRNGPLSPSRGLRQLGPNRQNDGRANEFPGLTHELTRVRLARPAVADRHERQGRRAHQVRLGLAAEEVFNDLTGSGGVCLDLDVLAAGKLRTRAVEAFRDVLDPALLLGTVREEQVDTRT